jgi:hypothetical protein
MPLNDLLIRRPIRASLVTLAAIAALAQPATAGAADAAARMLPVDRSESRAAHEELIHARRALVRARLATVRVVRGVEQRGADRDTRAWPGLDERRYLQRAAAEASPASTRAGDRCWGGPRRGELPDAGGGPRRPLDAPSASWSTAADSTQGRTWPWPPGRSKPAAHDAGGADRHLARSGR